MENEFTRLIKRTIDQTSCYLITNETDGIVESAWSNFEGAKKECQKMEQMKPHTIFMVVELPVNGL